MNPPLALREILQADLAVFFDYERDPEAVHMAAFTTLEEVVEHYDSGIHRSATLDPNLAKHPADGLGLSGDDKAALVAFLRTLSDPKFTK